jgi:HAD superfamily hydrolase (TIGR01549 family)
MIRDDRLFSVLVTLGGGHQGLSVIRALQECPNAKIVLSDQYSENICKHQVDAFHVTPDLADARAYVSTIHEICERHSIELIIPSTPFDLELLAANRDEFSRRNSPVAVSDFSLLRTVLDKRSASEWLAREGLPSLPTLDIRKPGEFPIVGKPIRGSGAKGFLVIRDEGELEHHDLEELANNFAWQPFIDRFDEISIDFAIGMDGAISPLTARNRLRSFFGVAIICDSVDDREIISLAAQCAERIRAAGGRGLFNIQILTCERGRFISDINPRIGTSAVFSLSQGNNLPGFLCRSVRPSFAISATRILPPPLRMVRRLTEQWVKPARAKSIRGIVFDLDDTLLDQKRWAFIKLRALADQFAERLPDAALFLDTAMRLFEEGNRSLLFDSVVKELGLDESILHELIEAYRLVIPIENVLYDDVHASLFELRAASYKLGVISDNPVQSQRQKLAACPLILELTHAVTLSREIGPEKPALQPFQDIATRLNLPPESLAMVGDNPYRDIVGAQRAGFGSCFLLVRDRGFFKFDESAFADLHPECPYFRIETLRDLLASIRLGHERYGAAVGQREL